MSRRSPKQQEPQDIEFNDPQIRVELDSRMTPLTRIEHARDEACMVLSLVEAVHDSLTGETGETAGEIHKRTTLRTALDLTYRWLEQIELATNDLRFADQREVQS